MSGNAEEWVRDWHTNSYEELGTRNPTGPAKGFMRVLRGGDACDKAEYLGTTARDRLDPSVTKLRHGIRCAKKVTNPQ